MKSVYDKICMKSKQAFISGLKFTGMKRTYETDINEYKKLQDQLKIKQHNDKLLFQIKKNYISKLRLLIIRRLKTYIKLVKNNSTNIKHKKLISM